MVEIYYQNVGGLKTKILDISNNILQSNYNVIAFTETWLNTKISNREIIDSRYNVYRKDRTLKSGLKPKLDGGGVLLAVSKHIPSYRISIWENDQETLWVILRIQKYELVKKIALCLVYLPPPMKLKSLEIFLRSVGIVAEEKRDIIVLGDLNLGPSIQGNTKSLQTRFMRMNIAVTNFMSSNNLTQVNTVKNSDKRLLDLVITNLGNVQVNKANHFLSKSHKRHPILLINVPF